MSTLSATGMVTLALVQIAGEDALGARVPVALERAREVLDRLLAQLAARCGGAAEEANVGGALFSFPDVRAAVGFSLRLQLELLTQEWPSTLLLRPEAAEQRVNGTLVYRGLAVRVGLHTALPCPGDPTAGRVPGSDQVARLAALAGPGQVLLTESTWRALVGNPGVPFSVRDLGIHRLPGVLGRQRVLFVAPAALDQRPVRVPASVDALRTNLPESLPPLLGRSGELSAISELFRLGVRLVTLAGPNGFGKREVARHVAALAREEGLGGGVWWCGLVGRRSHLLPVEESAGGDLVRALGDALGVGISHARTDADAAAQLGWSLSARERFLVVVEGLDTHDPESVAMLGRWVRTAPLGRFLCLAPQKLSIPGEVLFRLGPLALGAVPSDAARWLLQHVPARVGGLPLDPVHVEPLAALVHGAPSDLAIAGGLLAYVSPDELLGRLTDGPAGLLPLAWEFATDGERDVLRSAARFPGTFEPWQLADVVDAAVVGPGRVAPLLAGLASRSLIEARRSFEVPTRQRYRMASAVRAFVLSSTDTERVARDRRWATAVVSSAECWAAAAHGRGAAEVLARLNAEAPNVLAVVRWGLGDAAATSWGVDIAARALLALQANFETRGPFVAQVRLLDVCIRALDASLEVDPTVQVRVLAARAEAMAIRGKGRSCLGDLERGLEIAQRWSDPVGEALCQLGIGVARSERPEDDPAQELEAVAEALNALETPRREAIARATAGRVHFSRARTQLAEGCLKAAVEIARSIGAHRDEGRFLADLARVLWSRGRLRPARSSYREAARLHTGTGDRRHEAHVAASLGDLDQIEARLPEALASYALASQIARETGERRVECHAKAGTGMVSLELGDIDASRSALLSALAILREVGDARGEGMLVGQLGLVHHHGNLPTAARDYYERAIQAFPGAGDRRDRVIWLSWLGALHAEQGEMALAHEAQRLAAELLENSEDRGIVEVAGLLGCIVDLRVAAGISDPDEAARFEGPVRERYAAARSEWQFRSPEVRLALHRLERAMTTGFGPRSGVTGS